MCNYVYSLGKVSTVSPSQLRWRGLRCLTVPIRRKGGTAKKRLESMRLIPGVGAREKQYEYQRRDLIRNIVDP